MEEIRQGIINDFLQIAAGLLFELQTQLEIGYNLKYIVLENFTQISTLTKEIELMLISLIKKIH